MLHALLCLLPALLLAAALLARRYPGERALTALRRRFSPESVRNLRARPRLQSRPSAVLIARGSGLLGCSLAVRPPPPAA